jgi:hypothetical protein
MLRQSSVYLSDDGGGSASPSQCISGRISCVSEVLLRASQYIFPINPKILFIYTLDLIVMMLPCCFAHALKICDLQYLTIGLGKIGVFQKGAKTNPPRKKIILTTF